MTNRMHLYMGHRAGKRFALAAFGSVFIMASKSCPVLRLRRCIFGFNCRLIDCCSVLCDIHLLVVKLLARKLEYSNPATHRDSYRLIAL